MESAERLTQVIESLTQEVTTQNGILETELQQIADALSGAANADLQAAVDAAVPRLEALQTVVQEMSQRIGQIIPDPPPAP